MKNDRFRIPAWEKVGLFCCCEVCKNWIIHSKIMPNPLSIDFKFHLTTPLPASGPSSPLTQKEQTIVNRRLGSCKFKQNYNLFGFFQISLGFSVQNFKNPYFLGKKSCHLAYARGAEKAWLKCQTDVLVCMSMSL